MENQPKHQPSRPAGNGFWIGAACLVVGYLVGQATTGSTQQKAYADTTTPVSTPAADLSATTPAPVPAEVLSAAGLNATATDETMTADAEPMDHDEDYYPDTQSAYLVSNSAQAPAVQTADATSADSALEDAANAADAAANEVAATAPATTYQSTNATPTYSYVPPAAGASSTKCESLGCYGQISAVTGLPRTTYVHGYTRKDGTYVRPYYRSRRH